MYAIIFTGGKQYRVEVGDNLRVEKIEAAIGDIVKIPTLLTSKDGVINEKPKMVSAKIVEHGKGDKLNIFKYKPKKNERKRMGHRQPYTKITILEI